MPQQPSPFGSFLRFLVVFLVFIGISFGVTVAVNNYTIAQDKAEATAAAQAAMLGR